MKFVVILLLVGGAVLVALNFYLGVFDDIFFERKGQEAVEQLLQTQAAGDFSVQELEKEISLAPPLRLFQPAVSGSLSQEGIWQWTNVHRQEAGLSLLQRDALLDEIAERKIQDMFLHEYFEHVSPSGEKINDVAEQAGYEFIAIGENLALGNYASDQALAQAWMESPGHRANILGSRYQEIGIAAKKGFFEGNSTWLAVQVFALPLSACDFPSESLKEAIDFEKMQVEALALQLEQKRQELENERIKFGPMYNKKAAEYNTQVEQYNDLVSQMRAKVSAYNMQVREFNECVNP